MLARKALWLSRHCYTHFAIVGLVTYAIDASVLAIAVTVFGLDPYSGRAISLTFALVGAWYGNRVLTFSPAAARNGRLAVAAEFGRSAIARAAGILINFGVYTALIAFGPPPANSKFVALVLSGLAAVILNFQMMKRFVFRHEDGKSC